MFAQNLNNVYVYLKMENWTAVAFIQKMGYQKYSDVTNNSYSRNVAVLSGLGFFLSAEYLPGSLNTEVDWQSRNFHDSSDSRLRVSVFKCLAEFWDTSL